MPIETVSRPTFTRHGPAVRELPRVLGLEAAPKVGKTRAVGACLRGCPEWFGTRGIWVEVDPDGMGSILPEDLPSWERITLNPEASIFNQMEELIKYPWDKEGFGTFVIDTGSVLSQNIMDQVATLGRFGTNIDLYGNKQPTQGDYTGVDTLYMKLLNLQRTRSVASKMNFITTYHEREIHPEQGKPGAVRGVPATVGKALGAKIVGWYNFMGRIALKQVRRTNLSDPVTYKRILYTANHDIWEAGIRTGHANNPIAELEVGTDPAELWKKIYEAVNPSTNS